MYGNQDLHDSILVIPHAHMSRWCVVRVVDVGGPSGFTLLCPAILCGEDSVARWILGGAAALFCCSPVVNMIGVFHTVLGHRRVDSK